MSTRAALPLTDDAAPSSGRPLSRLWAPLALAGICLVQAVLALRPGSNQTPFEDEALYMYVGHQMVAHLLHGAYVPGNPGSYFSGAPGLYPVLAAIGDDLGGLRGARIVSLIFGLGATICVAGIGRELFGRRAALLGSLSFALCGSVLFISNFATFDSTMMFFVAAAAWLTVFSVKRDDYRWAPAVAALLVTAFFVKYAAAAYAPIIAALALTTAVEGKRNLRRVARRTAVMLVGGVAFGYLVYVMWGQSLAQGVRTTTADRIIENPASGSQILHLIWLWVGPWLVLAALGALVSRRRWMSAVVLLGGAVIGPLDEVRIGDQTSLSKHVAFGIVFAAPLIGLLLARLLDHVRLLTAPVVAGVLVALGGFGLHYSHQFMTGWTDDSSLLPPLRQAIEAAPGRPILGDQPDPERWALRSDTSATQWYDTYFLSFDHKTGVAAYEAAIHQRYFGVIYLLKQHYFEFPKGSPTAIGAAIYPGLRSGATAYRLKTTVPMINAKGVTIGRWYIFVLRHPAAPALSQ